MYIYCQAEKNSIFGFKKRNLNCREVTYPGSHTYRGSESGAKHRHRRRITERNFFSYTHSSISVLWQYYKKQAKRISEPLMWSPGIASLYSAPTYELHAMGDHKFAYCLPLFAFDARFFITFSWRKLLFLDFLGHPCLPSSSSLQSWK